MPLTLDRVSFHYPGGAPLLADLCLRVSEGELIAVTGPSGSGKSTLLQILGGLLSPNSGTVSGLPEPRTIRWVFQVPTALSRRSVLANVRLGLLSEGLDRAEGESRAMAALDQVGLAGLAGRRAGTVSGGELQRIQLARALAARPSLVLADEPTAQLDRAAAADVIGALRQATVLNCSVIVATHDPQVAQVCDRIVSLRDLAETPLPDATPRHRPAR